FGNDRTVGVELMTPSVTSTNVVDAANLSDEISDLVSRRVTESNDHIEYFDGGIYGYSVVEFTPDRCNYRIHSVDKTTDSSDPERELARRVEVLENGRIIDSPRDYWNWFWK
ncbi:MAG: hypothetical protein SXQ77_04245, partial [Halobacteria archaeon]|nr:hypothetical protein [Halobacteria archaeon]